MDSELKNQLSAFMAHAFSSENFKTRRPVRDLNVYLQTFAKYAKDTKTIYFHHALENIAKMEGSSKEWACLYREFQRQHLKDREKIRFARDKTAPLKCGPIAVVCQEPVGRGGFHHGVLGTDEPHFRWVFDCGAYHRDGLDRLRERVTDLVRRAKADQRPYDIDLLFVSHFDRDHVVGLDHLLKTECARVRTAVIPYVDAAKSLVTIGQVDPQRRWSDSLIELITNPAKWFSDRHVQHLVRLRPTPASPEPDPPGSDPAPRPRFPGLSALPPSGALSGESDSFVPVFLQPDGTLLEATRHPKYPIDVSVAEAGTIVRPAFSEQYFCDWGFMPFAFDAPLRASEVDRKVAEVVDDLRPEDEGFSEALIAALSKPCKIEKLRKMYRRIDTSNGVSLSLYSGPLVDLERVVRGSSYQPGWLLTGDSPLKARRRYDQWLAFYEQILPRCGHFMLPHHGAAGKYFNDRIWKISKGMQLYITAGENDKRPHRSIECKKITKVATAKALWALSGPSTVNNLSRMAMACINRW